MKLLAAPSQLLMSGSGVRDIVRTRAPPMMAQKRKKLAGRFPVSISCSSTGHGGGHSVYDLYEVLGLEKSASQQEIRQSYRWLQKKCHPDIAGPKLGHRMATLLNHAYATLSDPDQRAAYDQSLADSAELDGYSGVPLYSKWFGPPQEDQAVFVDEGRCIGCLKCALIAPRTFAIENKFGRARVVAQWADPKPVIEDAIQACPVDCITWVDRSQLAGFEFVMSKVSRHPVGFEAHSNGGVKPVDVFKVVEKFFKKLRERDERNTSSLKETPAQMKARLAAIEEIQARAGIWWHYFIGKSVAREGYESAKHLRRKAHGAIVPAKYYEGRKGYTSTTPFSKVGSHDEELQWLYDAVSRGLNNVEHGGDEEYWKPLSNISHQQVSRSDINVDGHKSSLEDDSKETTQHMLIHDDATPKTLSGWTKDLVTGMPVWTSGIAAWYVAVTGMSPRVALSKTDIGLSPLPIEWMHSIEMQIILVAIIWYAIGATFANTSVVLVELLRIKDEPPRVK